MVSEGKIEREDREGKVDSKLRKEEGVCGVGGGGV